MGSAGTTNPEAYRLYLEAQQQLYGRTKPGILKSVELFRQAVAADPNYALAWAGLSTSYVVAGGYGQLIPPHESLAAGGWRPPKKRWSWTIPVPKRTWRAPTR